jgi:uncharacterized protein YutD
MNEIVETKYGKFQLVKNYKEAFELLTFNERYVDYLDRYKYVVGDYSGELLRLKGFTDDNYETIPDYLMESCAPKAPYFVLMRMEEKEPSNERSNLINRRLRRKHKKNH